MNSKKIFYSIVAFFLVVGLTSMIHRHYYYEVSFLPGEMRQVWAIEAQVEFEATGEPITVSLAVPGDQIGFSLLDETTASLDYGLSFIQGEGTKRATWTKRNGSGEQKLYYQSRFLVDANANYAIAPSVPKLKAATFSEPYGTVASKLIENAHELSADSYSFTRELIKSLYLEKNQQNLGLLKSLKISPKLMVALLNNAGVPARLVRGLYLEDGRRRQQVADFLQVFKDDGQWAIFNLEDGQQGQPDDLLLWEYNGKSLLDVEGGIHSKVRFSIIQEQRQAHSAVADKHEGHDVMNFSLDSLPLQEQALFKTILLIPIGVLIVVLLRVLVGLKTSGTFMPVLIAMSFVQTTLVTGLIGFLLVVGAGLILRSYLSHLNLLLVSRISAVIISVITIITVFSVISFKLGLTDGLKITFFPMIILSWTIERMSILWEEEGAKEVVQQGGGSLLVAVLAYAAMNNEWVRHLTFNFLGLQFVLLALILVLGNYTGYRLLELRRFKPMAKGAE